MAQTPRVIKVEETYIPVDPDEHPHHLADSSYEDRLNSPKAIVAYDGKNFLPTAYGYKSFFGTQYRLSIQQLTARVDYVLLFQNARYENILVALCEDGIRLKKAEASGDWFHAVVHTIDEEFYIPWHYSILSNDLFLYRQGKAEVYKMYFNPADQLDALQTLTIAGVGLTSSITDGGPGNPWPEAKYAVAFMNAESLFTQPTEWYVPAVAGSGQTLKISWGVPSDATLQQRCRIYQLRTDGSIYYADIFAKNSQAPFYQATITEANVVWVLLEDGFPDYTGIDTNNAYIYGLKALPIKFLNTAGQVGMFSAGIRLGFWDAEDSVSWSSIDDPADFTPDLNTLAGSAIFSDVVGRIVTIKNMRDSFVIYATRSIVLVRKDLNSAFGWSPIKLLDTGITYPRQMVAGTQVDLHYAHTEAGIYKIEGATAELVLPEFHDLLKKTSSPFYLSLLANRWLMFASLDSELEFRQVRTKVDSIEGSVWKISDAILSGTPLEDLGDILDTPMEAFCGIYKGITASHSSAPGNPLPEDPDNPLHLAFYETNYSMGGIPPSIAWTTGGPCTTTEVDESTPVAMYPSNVLIGHNKHYLTLQDDPNGGTLFWQTIEKFTATQSAIWARMDENRKGLIQDILGKTYKGEWLNRNSVYNQPALSYNQSERWGIAMGDPEPHISTWPPSSTAGECEMGYLPLAYSAPRMVVNDCGIFLIRQCIARATVVRHTRTQHHPKEIKAEGNSGWHVSTVYQNPVSGVWDTTSTCKTLYGSPDALDAVWMAIPGTDELGKLGDRIWSNDGVPVVTIRRKGKGVGGASPTDYLNLYDADWFQAGTVKVRKTKAHSLSIRNVEYGVFDTDVGSMTILGWKQMFGEGSGTIIYRDGGVCVAPDTSDEPWKSPPTQHMPPVDPKTGSICGVPYEPIELPEQYGGLLEWPEQNLRLPGLNWLMQQGATAPAYPLFYGAYVYDTSLKKWGRHNDVFKCYLDYQPINNAAHNSIPYDAFLIKSGLVLPTGEIAIFDDKPSDSEICYGKIGYYRLGTTDLEEVRVQFASPSTGYLIAEPSFTGRFPEIVHVASQAFSEASYATLFANMSARWYNIVIKGQYDINYLEFRGLKAARR